jgi:hypothetical protein
VPLGVLRAVVVLAVLDAGGGSASYTKPRGALFS